MLKAEEEAKAADAARDKAILPIGNLVHDSVPVSNDEVPVQRLILLMGIEARMQGLLGAVHVTGCPSPSKHALHC